MSSQNINEKAKSNKKLELDYSLYLKSIGVMGALNRGSSLWVCYLQKCYLFVVFFKTYRMQLSSTGDPLQLNSDFKLCYNTHEVATSHGTLATLQGQTSRYKVKQNYLAYFKVPTLKPRTHDQVFLHVLIYIYIYIYIYIQ